MKKILLTTTLLSLSLFSFSQYKIEKDTVVTLKNKELVGRSAFASVSSSISSQRDFTISIEGGTWGLKKATSFSLCVDVVKNLDNPENYSIWFGIKPYYTFYDNGKVSYMFYNLPKFKLNNFDLLIENGFSMNYVASDQLLCSVGLGFQSSKEYTMIPSISLGVVFLLQDIYKK